MEQTKKNIYLRMLFAVGMIGAMIGAAELLQEKEIIFPEIAALVIGAWVCDKQPWKVNRVQMVILMSVSAAAGVLIVRYLSLPLFLQLMTGMIFIVAVLIGSRTTMLPIISACILPILMRTSSFVYVAAVMVMTLLIVLIQMLMEKMKLREGTVNTDREGLRVQSGRWLLIIAGFAVIAGVAVATEHIFFIAPPLIVTLAAVSQPGNAATKRPVLLWGVIVFCALIGACGRFVCMETQIPMVIAAMILMGLVLTMMTVSHCMFPPAGALALLPLIIASDKIMYYPIQVSLGAAVFLVIGRLISGWNQHTS